jgi:hypothetical protein
MPWIAQGRKGHSSRENGDKPWNTLRMLEVHDFEITLR